MEAIASLENFLLRPSRGPLRSLISVSKKPVRLLMSMTQLELANSNSDSCGTT